MKYVFVCFCWSLIWFLAASLVSGPYFQVRRWHRAPWCVFFYDHSLDARCVPQCFLLLICAIYYWTIPSLAALLTSPCLADCVCIFPALMPMLHQVESHVCVDIWYPEQHHVVLLNSKLHKIARIVVPMTFGSFGSHVRRLKGAFLLSKAAYNSNPDGRNQQINKQ